jgi:hypothetical protein
MYNHTTKRNRYPRLDVPLDLRYVRAGMEHLARYGRPGYFEDATRHVVEFYDSRGKFARPFDAEEVGILVDALAVVLTREDVSDSAFFAALMVRMGHLPPTEQVDRNEVSIAISRMLARGPGECEWAHTVLPTIISRTQLGKLQFICTKKKQIDRGRADVATHEDTGAKGEGREKVAPTDEITISSDEDMPEVEQPGFRSLRVDLLKMVSANYTFLGTPAASEAMVKLNTEVRAFYVANMEAIMGRRFRHSRDEDDFIKLVYAVVDRNGESFLPKAFARLPIVVHARMVASRMRRPVVSTSIQIAHLLRMLPCSSPTNSDAPSIDMKNFLRCITALGGWVEIVHHVVASETNRTRIKWWSSRYTFGQFGHFDEFYVILDIMRRLGPGKIPADCFNAFKISASRQVRSRIEPGHPDPLPLHIMHQFAMFMIGPEASMEECYAYADYILRNMRCENSPSARTSLRAVIHLIGGVNTAHRVLETLRRVTLPGWTDAVATCIPIRDHLQELIQAEEVVDQELLGVFVYWSNGLDWMGWPRDQPRV